MHLGLEVRVGLAGDAAGYDVEEEVGRVLVGGQLKADGGKVGECGGGGALERGAARLAQQQDLVEQREHTVAGLVDHRHYVHAQVRHPAPATQQLLGYRCWDTAVDTCNGEACSGTMQTKRTESTNRHL